MDRAGTVREFYTQIDKLERENRRAVAVASRRRPPAVARARGLLPVRTPRAPYRQRGRLARRSRRHPCAVRGVRIDAVELSAPAPRQRQSAWRQPPRLAVTQDGGRGDHGAQARAGRGLLGSRRLGTAAHHASRGHGGAIGQPADRRDERRVPAGRGRARSGQSSRVHRPQRDRAAERFRRDLARSAVVVLAGAALPARKGPRFRFVERRPHGGCTRCDVPGGARRSGAQHPVLDAKAVDAVAELAAAFAKPKRAPP